MLRGIDHRGYERLVRDPDGAPPFRGRYCVLIVVACLLFLAVVFNWILGMKGVR